MLGVYASAMPRYLVSYDLMNPEREHQLIAELERIGSKRILTTQWAVRANNTAAELRDHLYSFLGMEDALLISDLELADWAGTRLQNTVLDI